MQPPRQPGKVDTLVSIRGTIGHAYVTPGAPAGIRFSLCEREATPT
jgi:hypothetical protein